MLAATAGCAHSVGRVPLIVNVTPSASPTSTSSQLVPWTGPVEHLFFHTLVVRPALAFTGDVLGRGFRDFFVTVGEFRAILEQLDANGWTLVDIHRVVAGTVRVPPGRRPFVLSEDDVNYYDYSRPRGVGWRLVLDDRGNVKVEVRDERGVHVTDEDLVPMLDAFVARHPSFSADGAKGILAVTAYEGVLGERLDDSDSVARATRLAQRLKASGWVFASHSYGHIDFARDSLPIVTRDITRWRAIAEPVVGPTDIFIYPFGAAPPIGSPTVAMLRANGFSILCDIDVEARLTGGVGVVVMARRHIDGLSLEEQRTRLLPFFDARSVEDRAARYP